MNLTLNAAFPETIHSLIEILLENGPKHTLFVNAKVQDIHVGLNRTLVQYDVIYADQDYEIRPRNSRNINLINYGNIPAKFKWNPIEREDLIFSFEPKEGVIPPLSELPIMCKFVAHWGEALNEILICDVEDIGPIGFELKTPIEGLSVVYELMEEGYALGNMNGSKAGSMSASGSRSFNTSKRGLGMDLPFTLPGSKFDGQSSFSTLR